MLSLNQNESNLLYWAKGWYENNCHANFWPQLKILHKDYSLCDGEIMDIYVYVYDLWRKMIKASGREDFLIFQYETQSLPINARYYKGSPNFNENQNWYQSFNDEEILKARVAVMVSQLELLDTENFLSLFPVELNGLKIPETKKQQLKEYFSNDNLN